MPTSALLALIEKARNGVVLWDFDGVISDSEPTHQLSYLSAGEQLGRVIPATVAVRGGLPERETWLGMIETGALIREKDFSKLAALRRQYVINALLSSEPSWIAQSLLPPLQNVGAIQVIASNGDKETIDVLLDAWGLAKYFTAIDGNKHSIIEAGGNLMIEDNAAYLNIAKIKGFEIIGVRHSLNKTAIFPTCLELFQ